MKTNTPAEIKAADYDVYTDQYTKTWNEHLIRRIYEEAQDLSLGDGQLLDIGTGTARTLIDLAKTGKLQGFKFIGVDYFAEMVDKAKKNVCQDQLENQIAIYHGDVHQLAFPANSVEIIIGRSVIHHWADPIQAYKELFRILKPGGVLIIHEPCKNPSEAALTYFNQQRESMGINEVSLEEKFTREEVLEQLKQAGIEQYSQVIPGEGLYGIGFELLIKK